MSDYITIDIPIKHVKAIQDALVWASESANNEFDLTRYSDGNDWRYKRYELALDVLDVKVRQTLRGTRRVVSGIENNA